MGDLDCKEEKGNPLLIALFVFMLLVSFGIGAGSGLVAKMGDLFKKGQQYLPPNPEIISPIAFQINYVFPFLFFFVPAVVFAGINRMLEKSPLSKSIWYGAVFYVAQSAGYFAVQFAFDMLPSF